ncbi:mucin-15 isoform X2 [Dasypus novemcinctus]|uniref:mucin-15 isoform X2 n=1 Tax=Dasypus novemcinctus TaxID=9361 RepID=UPI000C817022
MLTSVKILLISILLSSIVFGVHGKQSPDINTRQRIAEGLKKENGTASVENEAKLDSDKENREIPRPQASNSSFLDIINKTRGTANSPSAFSIDSSSENPSTTTTFFTNPHLVHSFVSKLPQNSSLADEKPSPVSAPPKAVSAKPSEEFTWSLNTLPKDIMESASDNNSIIVSNSSTAPTTTSVTPLVTKPTRWLTTTSGNLAGFTPYKETTPQPTLKFTNNSKLFPNTPDSQEEDRNTGVLFGAILGAILGASLLSLVGYLLCRRRKTDSFSHQRLYDERNEPDGIETPFPNPKGFLEPNLKKSDIRSR